MIHKSEKPGVTDAGIHREIRRHKDTCRHKDTWRHKDTRRQLPGSLGFPRPESGDRARPEICHASAGDLPTLCHYPTLVEIAGTLLGLGDDEDAIVYLGDVHGISRYSEVRGSARGLRPGACVYAGLVGQLGVKDSRLVPVQTYSGPDLSQGLPRDPSRPWGVALISPETVVLPDWYLVRTEDFEALFARMRVKPERLLPLRDPDLVGQDFVGLKGNTGVELASRAATAEEVICSSPLRFCRPGEAPGSG